jgi:hypothetical protein
MNKSVAHSSSSLQLCLIAFQSLIRDMYHPGTVVVNVDNFISHPLTDRKLDKAIANIVLS